MKPAEAPKSSDGTQAKPSPRPPQGAAPLKRVTRASIQKPLPKKRNLMRTAVVVLGALCFFVAAGGLFGYGVYRYLDSQHAKDDGRQLAIAPPDLGAAVKPGPASFAADPPAAGKDTSAKEDARPQADPADAPSARPQLPDEPPPPKKESPAALPVNNEPLPAKPDNAPKPKPADAPKPADIPPPKPADDPAPKPADIPAPKPPDNPKPEKKEPKADDRLKPILAALKDKRPAARQQALDDLAKLGDDARPAAGAVCEVLATDTSPAVRQSALATLDKISPDLSKSIVTLVVEADPLKHIKAVRAISELGDDGRAAVPLLLTHLRSAATRFQESVPDVVEEDLRALAILGPDDVAAQKLIIESTQYTYLDRLRSDVAAPVRLAAVISLGDILQKQPEQAKNIVPKLIASTKTMADAAARAQAINLLGTVAESDADLRPPIVTGLVALIKAGDYNAIPAVAKCGGAAKDALPTLKQLKLHPQEAVRTAAADATAQIEDAVASAGVPKPKDGPKAAKDTDRPTKPAPAADDVTLPADLRSIAGRLKSGSPEDRIKATEDLAAMGDKAKPASRVLCEAALDPNQKLSRAALSALETINPDVKGPTFVLLVDDKAVNHKEALGRLRTLGDDGRPAAPVVRHEIKLCLEQIGNNPPRWGNTTLVAVVETAMETLSRIAPDDPQTVKMLIETTQFTSTTRFLTKNQETLTTTPFREDGVDLLGTLAESQEDERKQIVPVLTGVLKEGVERIKGGTLTGGKGGELSDILQGIAQVDEAGNALIKCGPEGKDILVKTVLPRLKDLEFNQSAEVRAKAEALKKKIEEGS